MSPPHIHWSQQDPAALDTLLAGGQLAMTCFRPEGGGGLTDEQVYERGTLAGGLGCTEEKLRDLWGGPLSPTQQAIGGGTKLRYSVCNQRAMRRHTGSPKAGPISCAPTGKPLADRPMGTAVAGRPTRPG